MELSAKKAVMLCVTVLQLTRGLAEGGLRLAVPLQNEMLYFLRMRG